MRFTFKKNNKQTKKPINRFMQDGASVCRWSLQTSIDILKYISLVIGIRPMAPVLKQVHLKASEHETLGFSVREEIFRNDNSLVVILLSKVVENEFLQTL